MRDLFGLPKSSFGEHALVTKKTLASFVDE